MLMCKYMKIRADDGDACHIEEGIFTGKSDFFEALHRTNREAVISINGINSYALHVILHYLETGLVELDNTNVIDLLCAADYSIIDELTQLIRVRIPGLIDPRNCIDLFIEAVLRDHLRFSNICYFYIWNNLDIVMKYSDIRNLTFEQLESFLTLNDFEAGTEVVVWKAICAWIETDLQNRLKSVPAILRRLNLVEYDLKSFQFISEHPYVSQNEHCKSIFSKIGFGCGDVGIFRGYFVTAAHEPSESCGESAREPQVFLCKNVKQGLIPRLDIGLCAFVYKYKTRIKTFAKRESFSPCFLTLIKSTIYAYQDKPQKFMSYNLIDRDWKLLACPPYSHSVASTFGVMSETIYSIWVNTVKTKWWATFYNSVTDQWTNVGQLSLFDKYYRIVRILTAVTEEKIFAVCVVEESTQTMDNFCVVFDPEGNTCEKLEMPSSMRSPCELVSYNDVFVLLEGKVWVMKIYDPRTDSWRNSTMMPCPFFTPEAVVINGRLIIHEKQGVNSLSPPLYWDMDQDSWHDASSIFPSSAICGIVEDKAVIDKHYKSVLKFELQNLMHEWH